jgi:uncharacterized membrane protein YqjE
MPHDPLDVIAESYRGIHESTQVIAQATTRMVETQQILAQTQLRMEATHRFGLWLQAVALTLLGCSLLGIGVLVWQHMAHRHESAALNQAVLNNTQIIDAQTRAILERMRQP